MLVLQESHYRELLAHAERAYPNECCGILLGRVEGETREVLELLACENVDPEPQHRYSISPADLIQAQLNARDLGLSIVGFYHSHPDCPPTFSPTDENEALWDDCSYVITSVEEGTARRSRSYRLRVDGHQRSLLEEPFVVSQTADVTK